MLKKWKDSDYFACSLVMIISFVIFTCLAYFVTNSYALNALDKAIILKVHSFSSVHSTKIPVFITNLGYGDAVIYLLTIPILILAYYKHYKSCVLTTLVLATSHLMIFAVKSIFHRARPLLEYRLMKASGFSFPSGHSFISMCFYGILIYLIFTLVENKWLKYTLSLLLSLLILLIGSSRVYLCVHYPSDVLGGFTLGVFWLSFWVLIYRFYVKTLKV